MYGTTGKLKHNILCLYIYIYYTIQDAVFQELFVNFLFSFPDCGLVNFLWLSVPLTVWGVPDITRTFPVWVGAAEHLLGRTDVLPVFTGMAHFRYVGHRGFEIIHFLHLP